LTDNAIFGTENLGSRKENYQVIEGDVVEHCDVCVVGSGAAGAVLANKLAAAGRSVVLLEKGGYFEGEDMNQRDEDMMPLLWKNSGMNLTEDLRIVIAQGACLGGSTVINDAVCFPIPQVTSAQWASAGVAITEDEWATAAEEVSNQIGVTPVREDELNRNSQMLRKGLELMGYTKHYANSRNCVNCMQCGLCHLGCHYEKKQDMRVTYIHRALNDPNSKIRVYCNCSAETISYKDGMVESISGEFLNRDGDVVHNITVNARIVVLSAGSIASSYLLLKNSIAQGKAGVGLALHPSPFVLGDFKFEVRGNQGIPMAYTLHEFGVTNGVQDGGFLVEGIYVPPLQFSLLMSGTGVEMGELMKRYNNFAMAGVLVRDESNGTISLTEGGFAKVSYSPSTRTLSDIAKGAQLIANMWFSLGATRVVTSHMSKTILTSKDEIPGLVDAIENDPQHLLLGSAHPQGGNRMGSDPDTCVVDSNCQVYGFKNLFVCDASVFPTAVGVNPQLTVMSLATISAERISARWDKDFAPIEIRDDLGKACTIRQPMYCGSTRLDEMFEVKDTLLPSNALVNSQKAEIVDGENWSFDPDNLIIYNNRYWKGFFSTDGDLVTKIELFVGGFWKKFSEEDGKVKGVTHPYETPVYAANEALDESYLGFGNVIRLKYTDVPYSSFYDFLKIVDKDTVLGKAFGGRAPPRGEQLLRFSMSRRYGIDFMTQDDFRAIFDSKARKPDVEEVLGVWEGRMISDSSLSPVMFRFRYYKDQGELKCNYVFGGFLPGTSKVKFAPENMEMFDLTGQLFHDEIRMVRKDVMIGEYCSTDSPIFALLGRASGFLMKEPDKVCLPYLLRRV